MPSGILVNLVAFSDGFLSRSRTATGSTDAIMSFAALLLAFILLCCPAWAGQAPVNDQPDVLPGRVDANGFQAGQAHQSAGNTDHDAIKFRNEIKALASGSWLQYGVAPSASPVFPKRSDLYKNGGVVGPSAIFTAWNGAAFTGSSMIFFGGGHADGSSNGLYGLNLKNGEWYQVAPEYPYDKKDGDCRYPSQAPTSYHTYDGIVYAAGAVYVWGAPGFAAHGYCWGNGTWKYDLAAKTWQRMPFSGGYASAYDGVNLYYYNGRNSWVTVNPADDSFTIKSKNGWLRESMNMIWDAARDTLWLTSNSGALYRTTKTGATTKVRSPYKNREIRGAGFDVGPDGRLYFWMGRAKIIVYDPDTGEWSEITGGRPDVGDRKIYSKWVYVKSLGVFAGISSFDEAPWYWKPPTGRVTHVPGT